MQHFVACFLWVYPVFTRNLLDFVEVRSLQYVQPMATASQPKGEPMDGRRQRALKHPFGRIGPRLSTYSLDDANGSISPSPELGRKPRLTVRCVEPDGPLEPVEVTFSLSPSYGIRTPEDAQGWFRRMLREHESFEVETARPGDSPLLFRSERVRSVVAE